MNRLLALASAIALFAGAANAAFTGYLKLPDIDGESKNAGGEHEVEYDLAGAKAPSATGANQTLSAGANRSETIKGGQATVLGVRWNGRDAAPAKGRAGTANVTLKRGVLSQSLQRLQHENRMIPSLTLTVGEGRNAATYKLERVFVKSWSTSGDADDRPTEEVAFYYNKISF